MSQTLQYFMQLSAYPRPSKKEEKIRNFLIDFFSTKWYQYKVDNTGNLVVYVPAKNSSSEKCIILQSHMDMVCVKTSDSSHDFSKDGIEMYESEWYLHAKDTSLWADNGIWIALAMMSVDLPSHPKMELVFTIDEEAWMSGVLWFDFSLLSGTQIINLDMENENEICISSAWGLGITVQKELFFQEKKYNSYIFELFWMKWWHSWVEIHKNRGNAIKVFFHFLQQFSWKYELYFVQSWYASNVIPSKIKVWIWLEDANMFQQELEKYLQNVKDTYDCPSLWYILAESDEEYKAISDIDILVKMIVGVKDWVYNMSQKIQWLVETSMNLWMISIWANKMQLQYLLRSSDVWELWKVRKDLEMYVSSYDVSLSFDRWYEGWQDDPNSELLALTKQEFFHVLWKHPEVIAIHAGLECGSFVSGLSTQKVNAVSIWPNVFDVHSVKEKVEIASIERIEKILQWILEKI